MIRPERNWKVLPAAEGGRVDSFAAELNIDPILASILIQRGVDDYDTAKAFFRPTMDALHDPFLMKDMDKAVDRLVEAIEKEENILVYGDYDVDGTTAVSLVYSYISSLVDRVAYYIPDRYKEGYGLSKAGVQFAQDNDFSLIITLDCGIKAVDLIGLAQNSGIDVIVCDHHRPGEELPPAHAVLDPKRADCDYPYKELCGCGVGYKLMKALSSRLEADLTGPDEYLDLLALAIGADIVPITGENRILMYYGMKKVNQSPSAGVAALMNVAVAKGPMTVTDLVFKIAPRINAAGRMGSGGEAVALLTADAGVEQQQMAEEIDRHNKDRKELDRQITTEALEMIQEQGQNRWTTVVYKSNWHKGVVGIVASRLMESYYRPTIVLTGNAGKITGSARSVRNFDVYEAIDECKDLLINFGGHKYAAGLTLAPERLEEFKERFEETVRRRMDLSLLSPQLTIDAELPLSSVNRKFYNILRQLAPFGPKNMKPLFVAHECFDTGTSKKLKEEHLRLVLFQKDGFEVPMSCIGFGLGHKLDLVRSGDPFSVVFAVEENVWQGTSRIQLNIKDIRRTIDVRP